MAMTLTIIGGIGVFGLALLFRWEEKHQKRLGEPLRNFLDQRSRSGLGHLSRFLSRLQAGSVRLFLHQLLNLVLQIFLGLIRRTEAFIESRARRNYRHTKELSRSLKETGHLHEIARHRADTALNEEQKRQLRSFK